MFSGRTIYILALLQFMRHAATVAREVGYSMIPELRTKFCHLCDGGSGYGRPIGPVYVIISRYFSSRWCLTDQAIRADAQEEAS
jgi:hypothetical protein